VESGVAGRHTGRTGPVHCLLANRSERGVFARRDQDRLRVGPFREPGNLDVEQRRERSREADLYALGTIFEKVTGTKIFEEFDRRIAKPIGMQDFSAADGRYAPRPDTIHQHYIFAVTARDMARFGYLYLRDGRWAERQVVPADWVRRSTMPYTTGLAHAEMPSLIAFLLHSTRGSVMGPSKR
jgi:CubicO group peptidase (beta-lactamase class C family)